MNDVNSKPNEQENPNDTQNLSPKPPTTGTATKEVTFKSNEIVEAINELEALAMQIAMSYSNADRMFLTEILRHLAEAKGWAYNMPFQKLSPIMTPKDHFKPNR